ncbi:MAG: polyphenol oxidase family protein [Alkalispirochaeta sp.]
MFDFEWARGLDGLVTDGGTVQAGLLLRSGGRSNPGGVTFWPAGTHSYREVALTRRLFAHHLNRSAHDLKMLQQVHGTRVVRRTTARGGNAESDLPVADAQFTTERGPVLIANVADCCPVIIASLKPTIVGIAHAGWRGAAHGVVLRLLKEFGAAGASMADLRCWVGPCAEARRYEVGSDTADHFASWPEAVALHAVDPSKRFLNVRAVTTAQLLQAGVTPQHVTVSLGGTIGDRRYHSHRRSQFAAGRMAAFVTVG